MATQSPPIVHTMIMTSINPCPLNLPICCYIVAQYETWQQVAGYFDGDGTIAISDLSNLPFRLSLSLIFVDQSYDQINNIRTFLLSNGIRTSNILKHYKQAAYMIAVKIGRASC